MPSSKKNLIRRGSVEMVQDKLQQQIDEGESLRTTKPSTWIQLEEFKAGRKIWADYTGEVLKALFGADDHSLFFCSRKSFQQRRREHRGLRS